MRHLLVLVVCMLAACRPPADTPNKLSAGDLVQHYRDSPRSSAYVNRPVVVSVPRSSYKCEGRKIYYYTGLPDTAPVIVFDCDEEQPERGGELLVHGVCLGITHDGIRKADRIHFTVRLSGCHVDPLP